MTEKGRTFQLDPVCLFSKPFKARPTEAPILALPSLYPSEPRALIPKQGQQPCLPPGLPCRLHRDVGRTLEFSVLAACSRLPLDPVPLPCRERERREKEREEWERQYSRQSRSPSPRYSEYPRGSPLSQAARNHGTVSSFALRELQFLRHTFNMMALVTRERQAAEAMLVARPWCGPRGLAGGTGVASARGSPGARP